MGRWKDPDVEPFYKGHTLTVTLEVEAVNQTSDLPCLSQATWKEVRLVTLKLHFPSTCERAAISFGLGKDDGIWTCSRHWTPTRNGEGFWAQIKIFCQLEKILRIKPPFEELLPHDLVLLREMLSFVAVPKSKHGRILFDHNRMKPLLLRHLWASEEMYKATLPPRQKTGFFDLPRELRDLIYDDALMTCGTYRRDSLTVCYGRRPVHRDAPWRYAACQCDYFDLLRLRTFKKARSLRRQMRDEADEMFLQKNAFTVMMADDADGSRAHRACVAHALWRHARHLTFTCYSDYGWLCARRASVTFLMDERGGRWGRLVSDEESVKLFLKQAMGQLDDAMEVKESFGALIFSEIEEIREALQTVIRALE